MDKIQNQKHTIETLYYSISRMLERASYYGFRALVVLYMVGETLKMERAEALTIYGWLIGSLVFSQIIGGLFGDLLIGNKKSIIIGGIIQTIGAFSLCIPSTTGLYLGLFLVVLGSGFFTPNLISNFGKSYLNKAKLLDSGFTIFYLAINLGSFLGILLIGYIGETYGYNIGFVLSGILMLISIIPITLTKEKRLDEIEKNEFPISKRILNILIAFIVVGLFWGGFYELSSIRTFDLQLQLSEISTLGIPNHLWQSINSIFILPISIIAIILWTYFYNSQFFKLMLGFIFGVLSFGILFLIPEVPTEQHTITYLISLLFLGISEIHIAPIIHSILTKYSNPKYLAILISLAFLPTRLISLIFGLFNDKLYDNPMLGLIIGIVGMIVVGIGLIGYLWWNKKTTYNKELR
ncbi:di-/tripeptide transporter [Nonlabens ulvanivorans]|uniref:Di-/tripeptide transporter n=1 Tax=Nonlabens ulvanivorans TaxID=906888 RepID=A0A090WKP3_NONUL|nr:MFS transporter [Nonlabens ulvanivorans]GAL76793.1 di-/tripeptide transporter [Nonlabens ulvanivorans]